MATITKERPAQRRKSSSGFFYDPEATKERRMKLIAALNSATPEEQRAEADLIDRLNARTQNAKVHH